VPRRGGEETHHEPQPFRQHGIARFVAHEPAQPSFEAS
jgi:hypothetical protein